MGAGCGQHSGGRALSIPPEDSSSCRPISESSLPADAARLARAYVAGGADIVKDGELASARYPELTDMSGRWCANSPSDSTTIAGKTQRYRIYSDALSWRHAAAQ
ncbi:MAG: hypothetical protein C4318_08585 [Acidimicrobiia bacterium]